MGEGGLVFCDEPGDFPVIVAQDIDADHIPFIGNHTADTVEKIVVLHRGLRVDMRKITTAAPGCVNAFMR